MNKEEFFRLQIENIYIARLPDIVHTFNNLSELADGLREKKDMQRIQADVIVQDNIYVVFYVIWPSDGFTIKNVSQALINKLIFSTGQFWELAINY